MPGFEAFPSIPSALLQRGRAGRKTNYFVNHDAASQQKIFGCVYNQREAALAAAGVNCCGSCFAVQ